MVAEHCKRYFDTNFHSKAVRFISESSEGNSSECSEISNLTL